MTLVQIILTDGISLFGRDTPAYILEEVGRRQAADRGTSSIWAKLAADYGPRHANFIVKHNTKFPISRNDRNRQDPTCANEPLMRPPTRLLCLVVCHLCLRRRCSTSIACRTPCATQQLFTPLVLEQLLVHTMKVPFACALLFSCDDSILCPLRWPNA